jgi:hypothetical protein
LLPEEPLPQPEIKADIMMSSPNAAGFNFLRLISSIAAKDIDNLING